jgi:hypothetical protein
MDPTAQPGPDIQLQLASKDEFLNPCQPGSADGEGAESRRQPWSEPVDKDQWRTDSRNAYLHGMCSPSSTRPPDRKLTSVSAGHSLCGAPRRNRTGDPILTMEPPGTAVRSAVSPGRARPSWPKLSVLFRLSYAFSNCTPTRSCVLANSGGRRDLDASSTLNNRPSPQTNSLATCICAITSCSTIGPRAFRESTVAPGPCRRPAWPSTGQAVG